VDDDQDLAREHGALQVGGFVDRHADPDQGAGDRAAAAAGQGNVPPQVAGAEDRAEAGHGHPADPPQPVHELGQAVAVAGVLQIFGRARVALERVGLGRRARHDADRARLHAGGLQRADRIARRLVTGIDAGHGRVGWLLSIVRHSPPL
jgi:hypothetical protein